MRSVAVALIASAVAIAVAIAVVLSQAPPVVAGNDAVTNSTHINLLAGGVSSCQQVGTVPRGTSALRISVGAGAGPRVRVRVLSNGRAVTHGELAAGWGLAAAAVVPVTPLSRDVPDALVCTTLGPGQPPIRVAGSPRLGAAEGTSFDDLELRIEYLRPGSRSWWSLASSIVTRMGLGRAESGTWIPLLALLLMIAAGALAARSALEDLR
ncbi:MAG TPA: hypothetical protein VK790_06845 [Solirubrobacteraceae bacterium]|jgi:hypothetical protein|nr:hypothetical protein [Solirubrobacteraceae bacterium]